jgi:hypothetical protein
MSGLRPARQPCRRAAGGEGLAVGLDHLLALAREALDDAVEQHLGRERQLVGDGAEHDGVAEAQVAEVAGDRGMASKATTVRTPRTRISPIGSAGYSNRPSSTTGGTRRASFTSAMAPGFR